MTVNRSLAAAAGAALLLLATGPVRAEGSTSVGVLECQTVPGSRINLLVRSTVDIRCTFKADGIEERYKGETGIALGLDLSFRKNERFSFAVLSTSSQPPASHALAGKYVGGKAVASAGVGLGAAALIGGSDNSFGLQPLAIETNRGVGVAAGLGFLYLEPDK